MASKKEAKTIRKFVCAELRDEPDLRYCLNLQEVFGEVLVVPRISDVTQVCVSMTGGPCC